MSSKTVELGLVDHQKVQVRHFWRFGSGSGPHNYPQAVRAWSAERAEKMKPAYLSMEPFWAAQLASFVTSEPCAHFSPKSRFPFADTYRKRVAAQWNNSTDISERFEKVDLSVCAGGENTSVEDVFGSTTYTPCGDEREWSSLVMVDDVVAGFKTTTAMLSHLVKAGVPIDCKFTVVSLLRIPQSNKQTADQCQK